MPSSAATDRFARSMFPTYGPLPILPDVGVGSRLTDTDGRTYLDLTGGIAVSALGHAHPALRRALDEQASKLWHLSNVFTNEPALALAEELTWLTFADRVYFSNSGAEANEAAFKAARRWAAETHGPRKHDIVALHRSFHGRTFFTVTVGGQPSYSDGFGPKPGGIVHVEPDDATELIRVIGPNTCAVVMEPVMGEGGVHPLTREYLELARTLCDRHDALLIFDEIQSGVGRTGHLFAYEGFGVTPDILTSAKALGGGFPIGATLATDRVAEALVRGTHGSTFGGNPLACSVAGAVLAEVTRPDLLANVAERHEQLVEGLESIASRTGIFTDVRGLGLLIGAQLAPEFAGQAKALQLAAVDHGVLTLMAGADVARFTPPLNITEAELGEALESYGKAAASFTTAV